MESRTQQGTLWVVGMKQQVGSRQKVGQNSHKSLQLTCGMERQWTLRTISTLRERSLEDLTGTPTRGITTYFFWSTIQMVSYNNLPSNTNTHRKVSHRFSCEQPPLILHKSDTPPSKITNSWKTTSTPITKVVKLSVHDQCNKKTCHILIFL